jgi:hypothetical protein
VKREYADPRDENLELALGQIDKLTQPNKPRSRCEKGSRYTDECYY